MLHSPAVCDVALIFCHELIYFNCFHYLLKKGDPELIIKIFHLQHNSKWQCHYIVVSWNRESPLQLWGLCFWCVFWWGYKLQITTTNAHKTLHIWAKRKDICIVVLLEQLFPIVHQSSPVSYSTQYRTAQWNIGTGGGCCYPADIRLYYNTHTDLMNMQVVWTMCVFPWQDML